MSKFPRTAYGLQPLTHERLTKILRVFSKDTKNERELVARRIKTSHKDKTARTYVGLQFKGYEENLPNEAFSVVFTREVLQEIAREYGKNTLLQAEKEIYGFLNTVFGFTYTEQLVLDTVFISSPRTLEQELRYMQVYLNKQLPEYHFKYDLLTLGGDNNGRQYVFTSDHRNRDLNVVIKVNYTSKNSSKEYKVVLETTFKGTGQTITRHVTQEYDNPNYQNIQNYVSFKDKLYVDLTKQMVKDINEVHTEPRVNLHELEFNVLGYVHDYDTDEQEYFNDNIKLKLPSDLYKQELIAKLKQFDSDQIESWLTDKHYDLYLEERYKQVDTGNYYGLEDTYEIDVQNIELLD